MPKKIRIRVFLNKGRKGIPLEKLAGITKDFREFLEMLAKDLNLSDEVKGWIAENFQNSSLIFDCTSAVALNDFEAERGYRHLSSVMRNDYKDPEVSALISRRTREQYSKVANNNIDADEVISFGLFSNGNEDQPTDWFQLDREQASLINDLPDKVIYDGDVQGVVHALFKESDRPKLKIRELSTGSLIDCYFRPSDYNQIVKLLEKKDSVVFVEGRVEESLLTGEVRSVEVRNSWIAPEFDERWFESKIGTFDLGDEPSEKFIESIRDAEAI